MVFLSETCDGYNSRTRALGALGPIFPDAPRQGLSNEPKTTPIDSAVVEIRSLRGLRMQRSAMVVESRTGTSIAGGPNRKKNRTAANPPTVGCGQVGQPSNPPLLFLARGYSFPYSKIRFTLCPPLRTFEIFRTHNNSKQPRIVHLRNGDI